MADVAFPTLPEDVLEELAAQLGGAARVEIDHARDGCAALRLIAISPQGYQRLDGAPSYGHKLITIIEPPTGWPVRVIHHHADPSHETEYKLCGEGHCPNRARLDPKTMLFAEKDEYDQQQTHTPIDTPEKLRKLCGQLLASDHCKHTLNHARRLTHRLAKALAEQEKIAAAVKAAVQAAPAGPLQVLARAPAPGS